MHVDMVHYLHHRLHQLEHEMGVLKEEKEELRPLKTQIDEMSKKGNEELSQLKTQIEEALKKGNEELSQLKTQIEALKKENEELRVKMEAIKPLHIERIEYKIHELHVDTLSGTLNVGLTATGDDSCVGEVIEKIVEEHRSNIIDEEDQQEIEEGNQQRKAESEVEPEKWDPLANSLL
jgi:spore germination protein PC